MTYRNNKPGAQKERAASQESGPATTTFKDSSEVNAHDRLAQDIRRHLHKWMVFGLPWEALIELRTDPDLPAGCTLMDINIGKLVFEVFISGWQPPISAMLDRADIDRLIDGHEPIKTYAEMQADPRSEAEMDRDELNACYATGERMLDRRDNPRNWAPRAIPSRAAFHVEVRRFA